MMDNIIKEFKIPEIKKLKFEIDLDTEFICPMLDNGDENDWTIYMDKEMCEGCGMGIGCRYKKDCKAYKEFLLKNNNESFK